MPELNFLAIAAATIVSFIANAVWFLVLFAAPYTQALGKTQEQMDQGPSMLAASIMQIVGIFVTATVLAYLMRRANYDGVAGGLTLGALTWLGFVAAVLAPMYAFQAFGVTFFLITAGSVLMTLLISGAIIGAWG